MDKEIKTQRIRTLNFHIESWEKALQLNNEFVEICYRVIIRSYVKYFLWNVTEEELLKVGLNDT